MRNLVFFCVVLAFLKSTQSLDVKINLSDQNTVEFPHFWEKCVGSGHASLTTRADWRAHLTKVSKDLGFEYVRYHAVLDDKSLYWTANKGHACYFDVLETAEFLLSIGMKPIVELSFTPDPVNNGTKRHFWYGGWETVPTDLVLYGKLIQNFTQTLVDYFGVDEVKQWYFEVYNEADLHWMFTDYYPMYKAAAEAVKRVDESLQIGGPASAFSHYVEHLTKACQQDGTPLDFVSTHAYPTTGHAKEAEISGLIFQVTDSSKWVNKTTPYFITEWNAGPSSRDPYHDEIPQAAFVVASIDAVSQLDKVPDIFSIWAFSDVFTEGGLPAFNVPFHGGFGLVNLYGIPKPTYRAFQMLHDVGTSRYPHTTNKDTNITILPILNQSNKQMTITLAHHACPECEQIFDETINLTIEMNDNLPTLKKIIGRRLDQQHCNVKQVWKNLGSPNYLNPELRKVIEEESRFVDEEISFTTQNGVLMINRLVMQPFSVLQLIFQN